VKGGDKEGRFELGGAEPRKEVRGGEDILGIVKGGERGTRRKER